MCAGDKDRAAVLGQIRRQNDKKRERVQLSLCLCGWLWRVTDWQHHSVSNPGRSFSKHLKFTYFFPKKGTSGGDMRSATEYRLRGIQEKHWLNRKV